MAGDTCSLGPVVTLASHLLTGSGGHTSWSVLVMVGEGLLLSVGVFVLVILSTLGTVW